MSNGGIDPIAKIKNGTVKTTPLVLEALRPLESGKQTTEAALGHIVREHLVDPQTPDALRQSQDGCFQNR